MRHSDARLYWHDGRHVLFCAVRPVSPAEAETLRTMYENLAMRALYRPHPEPSDLALASHCWAMLGQLREAMSACRRAA